MAYRNQQPEIEPIIKKLSLENWQMHIVGTYNKDADTLEDGQQNSISRLERLGPKIKKSSKVLIISNGNNFLPIYLASKYRCKITVMCQKEEQLEALQDDISNYNQDDNVEVVAKDLNITQFDYDKFDMIWSLGALGMEDNLKTILREMKRIMVPKGRLLMVERLTNDKSDDELKINALQDLLKDASDADLEKVYEKHFVDETKKHYSRLSQDFTKNKSSLEKSMGKPEYEASLMQIGLIKDRVEDERVGWRFLQFQKRND